MRALVLWIVVSGTPFALSLVSCKSGEVTTNDATPSAAPSDSAPHAYGDLTDTELRDAVLHEQVIAMVRPQSSVREDLGTKNEATRYELLLLKPLLGSPPSNAIRHGEGLTLVIGRAYVVIVDRHAFRELVRAVEVPEDKLRDVAAALVDRLAKSTAEVASAQASADVGVPIGDGGALDAAHADASVATPATSAKPSGTAATSTSAKPSTSAPLASAKPSAAPK